MRGENFQAACATETRQTATRKVRVREPTNSDRSMMEHRGRSSVGGEFSNRHKSYASIHGICYTRLPSLLDVGIGRSECCSGFGGGADR